MLRTTKARWKEWLRLAGLMGIITLTGIECNEAQADKGDITIHTVSAHASHSVLNNINPGIAVDLRDNMRVGAVYNSYGKPTIYLAGFKQVLPNTKIGLGMATGYKFDFHDLQMSGKTLSAVPVIAAEVDLTEHFSLLWFGYVINLQLKF